MNEGKHGQLVANSNLNSISLAGERISDGQITNRNRW